MAVRVMVADDKQVVRAGIAQMLAGTDMEIACQAVDGNQAINYALTCQPDLLILDADLPSRDGLQVLKELKDTCAKMSIVLFSASDSLSEMAQAYRLGADGFISKGAPRSAFLETVRRSLSAKKGWTRQQLRRAKRASVSEIPGVSEEASLTKRELDIVREFGKGSPNDEIAELLGIDIETVKQYTKRLLAKLGLECRTQAAIWAVRHGLA